MLYEEGLFSYKMRGLFCSRRSGWLCYRMRGLFSFRRMELFCYRKKGTGIDIGGGDYCCLMLFLSRQKSRVQYRRSRQCESSNTSYMVSCDN